MQQGELCVSALRLAGVGGVGRAPSAEEMNIALEALNQMLFSWALDGLDVGHQAGWQFDELALDDAYLKAVRYALAVELAAEFKNDVNPAVVAIAIDETNKVRNALVDINTLRVDPAIQSRSKWFNFSRGY